MSVHTPFPASFILDLDSEILVGRVLRALSSSPSETYNIIICDHVFIWADNERKELKVFKSLVSGKITTTYFNTEHNNPFVN